MDKNISMNDLYLLRCVVTKVTAEGFEAKDYNGKKYIIAKNDATKNYKVGTDSTFYATKSEEGFFIKKTVLYPLTSKEYEDLVVKNTMIKMPLQSFA